MIQLSYASLVVVITWIRLARRPGREYPMGPTKALTKHEVGSSSLLVADRWSTGILQQGLDNSHVGLVKNGEKSSKI